MNLFRRISNGYSITTEFEDFLKQNNVEFRKEVDESDSSTDYFFDYQGGHFKASITKSDRFVTVHFPGFHEVEVEYIDQVRTECNRFNNNISVFTATYTYTGNEDMVAIHLSFCSDRVVQKEFASRLGACFYLQRRFTEELSDAIKEHGNDDIEALNNQYRHNVFLVNQQEMSHQAGEPEDYRYNDVKRCTLGQFVHVVAGWENMEYKELTVSTQDGITVLTDAEAITDTDIIKTLVRDDATGYTGNVATLVLRYRSAGRDEDSVVSFTVTPAGCDEASCYVRVSLLLIPDALSHVNTLRDPKHSSQGFSVVLAHDREPIAKKLQEFKYMWEDAVIKLKGGEEITDEQRFLASISLPAAGYNYYWGMRHFHQGRYYEALVHLENVYEEMRRQVLTSSDGNYKDQFFRVCFYLGFCYNEIGNYKMAFFYLNVVGASPRIQYAEEYINTLANSADIRTFQVIDGVLTDVNESIEKETDEVPRQLLEFRDFLYRRKGYTYIEYGFLDEAEELFKSLLESPISHDYAVNELAHIQRLRRTDTQEE